jgi:peptide/nickel transport system permease protein
VSRYIIKKIIISVLVILGVSVLTFAMGRLAPGDPVDTVLAGTVSPTQEEIDSARRYLGLDQPVVVQYFKWLSHAVRGDLGVSYQSGQPVLHELAIRLPQTMLLTLGSLIIMLVFAFPLGIISALNHSGFFDYVIRFINVLAISIPSFCIGILLILFFGVEHRLLPVMGSGSIKHLIMPSLAIGIGTGAGLARLIRSQILRHMEAEYVIAARVFGVRKSAILRNHVLKNAIAPIITNIGLMIGGMLGGSAIIETLFSWPGAGSYVVSAIYARDYPVIQAYALAMAGIYIIINILIELSYCVTMPSVFMHGGGDGN